MDNNNKMTKGEKTGLVGLGIGAAGLLAYGIYYDLTGQSVVSQCEKEQTALFQTWLSTLETYLQEDSKNGISLTTEQQNNLNYIQTELNQQQQSCIAAAKKLNQSVTDIIATDTAIIAGAIATAIIIYGLASAYKRVNKIKPPKTGSGYTWDEALAYMAPLIVDHLYYDGDITQDMAEAMAEYSENTLEPQLESSAEVQINYLVAEDILVAAVAAAAITLAIDAIGTDIAIIGTIAAVAA